jgi:hypothetical protein
MSKTRVICADHVFVKRGVPAARAAIVIRNGRIFAVCAPGEAPTTADGAETFDFGDAFVCPGFHDAHQHVLHAALFPSTLADEYCGASEKDCVAHLLKWLPSHPTAAHNSGWIVSHGWRDMLWDPPQPPTKASLDAVFPRRPVCMYSGDAHTVWLNSAGLMRLGLSDNSEPPAGGVFVRDAEGHLTGVLRESAGMVYMAKVLASLPHASVKHVYEDYFKGLISQGVTSVCDMALSAVPGADCVNERLYEELLAEGHLPLRVHLFPQLVGDFDRIEALQKRLCGPYLRAPGMKQFFDGVSSAHTAWLTQPYANPYFPGDCGRPTVCPEQMRSFVLSAARRGIAVRIHTIGDRAIHEAIAIFREATQRYGRPRQGANTLEHLENLLPEDVDALAKAGIIASVQPQHIVIDITQPERDLGPERAHLMWPFESFVRRGVTMAFGTDAPCVPPRALEVLSCAVLREVPSTGLPKGGWLPSERITMEDALDAYTLGSAKAVGRADELGTLEPGKWADFAVFDHDLLSIAPQSLPEAHCLATYIAGQPIFIAGVG